MLSTVNYFWCFLLWMLIVQFGNASDPGKWKIIASSKVDQNMYNAGFHNETFGITIGISSSVYYTIDKGNTWKSGINSSRCLFGLEILDEKHAWICGNDGQIRYSNNNGNNWQICTSFGGAEPWHPKFISFSDDMNGAVATKNKIGITCDGGKMWIEIAKPESLEKIASIQLLSPKELLVISSEGMFFRTLDQGRTWENISIDLKGRRTSISSQKLFPTCAVRFLDSGEGLLVIFSQKPKKELLILKTYDKGQTWIEQTVEDDIDACDSLYISHDIKYITLRNNSFVKLLAPSINN